MIALLYRLLTDKRVRCRQCKATVGYVTRQGHAAWLCVSCGNGEFVALPE